MGSNLNADGVLCVSQWRDDCASIFCWKQKEHGIDNERCMGRSGFPESVPWLARNTTYLWSKAAQSRPCHYGPAVGALLCAILTHKNIYCSSCLFQMLNFWIVATGTILCSSKEEMAQDVYLLQSSLKESEVREVSVPTICRRGYLCLRALPLLPGWMRNPLHCLALLARHAASKFTPDSKDSCPRQRNFLLI